MREALYRTTISKFVFRPTFGEVAAKQEEVDPRGEFLRATYGAQRKFSFKCPNARKIVYAPTCVPDFPFVSRRFILCSFLSEERPKCRYVDAFLPSFCCLQLRYCTPRTIQFHIRNCAGAALARSAPDAQWRSPAFLTSRMCSSWLRTTAAFGRPAIAFTNPPTAARRGHISACATANRSAQSSSILATLTACT